MSIFPFTQKESLVHTDIQSDRRIGQVQVPGNLGGIRRRPQSQATPNKLLATPDHGGAGGCLLRDSVWGRERCDAGRPAAPPQFSMW